MSKEYVQSTVGIYCDISVIKLILEKKEVRCVQPIRFFSAHRVFFLKGFTVVFWLDFFEKNFFLSFFARKTFFTKIDTKKIAKIFTEGFSVKMLLKDLVQKNFQNCFSVDFG